MQAHLIHMLPSFLVNCHFSQAYLLVNALYCQDAMPNILSFDTKRQRCRKGFINFALQIAKGFLNVLLVIYMDFKSKSKAHDDHTVSSSQMSLGSLLGTMAVANQINARNRLQNGLLFKLVRDVSLKGHMTVLSLKGRWPNKDLSNLKHYREYSLQSGYVHIINPLLFAYLYCSHGRV